MPRSGSGSHQIEKRVKLSPVRMGSLKFLYSLLACIQREVAPECLEASTSHMNRCTKVRGHTSIKACLRPSSTAMQSCREKLVIRRGAGIKGLFLVQIVESYAPSGTDMSPLWACRCCPWLGKYVSRLNEGKAHWPADVNQARRSLLRQTAFIQLPLT